MPERVVVFLGICTLLSLTLVVLMHVAVRRVLRRPVANGLRTPPVSILKPLRGIDDGLVENLESFARLDYPEFELLLGAEDPEDPALPVARAFQRRHPGLSIRVLVCDRPFGRNPKVNVLVALAAEAQYGVFLVSDSNVRVRPRFLADTAAELGDPRVALVTNPVVGAGEATLGSALENAHLDSFIVGAICGTHLYAGKACVLGKSMLFRRDVFEEVCGWRDVRSVLAEDYFMGRRFEQAGWKVAIAPHAVVTWNERWTIDRFLARHIRWSQLRRRIDPLAYLAEPILNPVPLAVALLLASLSAGSANGVVLAAAVIAIKAASDATLSRHLRGPGAPLAVGTTLLKDLLLPFVWLQGAFRTTVDWRGHRIGLGRHTRLFAPPASPQLAPMAEAAHGRRAV